MIFPDRKSDHSLHGLLVTWLLSFFSFCPARAQDTSRVQRDLAETFYQIKLLQLTRALEDTASWALDAEVRSTVLTLKREAEREAQAGAHAQAIPVVEAALDILQSATVSRPSTVPTDSAPSGADDVLLNPPPARTSWNWQVMTGVDLWRQELELALGEEDSTILEGSGNPFTGLRFGFGRRLRSQGWFRNDNVLKYSRDYFSGENRFTYSRQLGSRWDLHLLNQLEGIFYQRAIGLKYLQEELQSTFNYRGHARVGVTFKDFFRLRNYFGESRTYPSYVDNQLAGLLQFSPSISTRWSALYGLTLREHFTFNDKDYTEHRWNASLLHSFSLQSTLFAENDIRLRQYTSAATDSSFENDYLEEVVAFDLKFPFALRWAVRLGSEFAYRNYRVASSMTPDFLWGQFKPSFVFDAGSSWTLGAGYVYGFRHHRAEGLASVTDVNEENYYEHGLSLSVDWLTTKGIVLSLLETYRWRRYPNALAKSISDFSLYSDRNVNSILLYLSWNFSPDWELSVIANYDDDRDRQREHSDALNTLFSLDLNYRF